MHFKLLLLQLLSIKTGYRSKKNNIHSPTLISTLVKNNSNECEYSQEMLSALCGSLRFCVFKHQKSNILCKCLESSTPEHSQFHLPNQPLRKEECGPLEGHFCLPLQITPTTISNNSCFMINLTQIKVSKGGNRTLLSSQFFCLGVSHPSLALLEMVHQISIEQVLNSNIEKLQIIRRVGDLEEGKLVLDNFKWVKATFYIVLIGFSIYKLMC